MSMTWAHWCSATRLPPARRTSASSWGTGTSAQDNLDVSVSAVSVAALGLTGTSISGSDGSNADTASAAVSTAIDNAQHLSGRRRCLAEPDRLRVSEPVDGDRERRIGPVGPVGPGRRQRNQRVHQQAGPPAGRCFHAGAGEPAAAEPAAGCSTNPEFPGFIRRGGQMAPSLFFAQILPLASVQPGNFCLRL